MNTRKIAEEFVSGACRHPEHNPPSMRVFLPGTYEHECPACHHRTVFHVHGARMGTVVPPTRHHGIKPVIWT